MADYCDVLFMPTTGQPQFKNTEYRSPLPKEERMKKPRELFSKTHLDPFDIEVELTATTTGLAFISTIFRQQIKANIIL